MAEARPFRVLTIAGSDSGGGAGIQADLKTFQALGCYGMSVVTALTAQNTVTVRSIFSITPQFVSEQIEAVLEDIGADAVKIGMIHTAPIIDSVVASLKKFHIDKIVLDPVMVAKGGSLLLETGAVEVLKRTLLPLASIITPNLPEAEILTGASIRTKAEMERATAALLKLCPCVVLKGGHLAESESSSDLFATNQQRIWIDYPRIKSRNTHGTGCTFSSAIATFAARGLEWKESVMKAREYLQQAILEGSEQNIGQGHGPVDHAWCIRRKS